MFIFAKIDHLNDMPFVTRQQFIDNLEVFGFKPVSALEAKDITEQRDHGHTDLFRSEGKKDKSTSVLAEVRSIFNMESASTAFLVLITVQTPEGSSFYVRHMATDGKTAQSRDCFGRFAAILDGVNRV